MFARVGAVRAIAPKIGRFIGTKAEVRPKNLMNSPVSGWTHESSTLFFARMSSA